MGGTKYRPVLIVIALAALVIAGGIWLRVRQAGPLPTDQNQSLLPSNTAIGTPQIFPTRPPGPTLCLPGIGVCPDSTLCPKSGLCCKEGETNCQAPPGYYPLTVGFCLNPGQPDCPGNTACPASGVCLVDQKSYPACVPGSTCADGTICSPQGYCFPNSPLYTPCLPIKGVCSDGSQCPQAGICPR